MADLIETRRRFMAHFAGIGLGTTLAPGILWARMQDAGAQTGHAGDGHRRAQAVGHRADRGRAHRRWSTAPTATSTRLRGAARKLHIPNDVSPPFHFSPIVPGITVNKTKQPFRLSAAPAVKRPGEPRGRGVLAGAPSRRAGAHAAGDVGRADARCTSRGCTATTPLLNNVVTFLDDHGRAEAKRADAEIAAGKYKGPLHGIPWGAKDIISVKGYKTTWGSPAFKDQVLDYDASVVEMLRDAGAVLIAKLATGELAGGDNWFGGQTKSPWDPTQGSSGSSAGPSSATAAGCVAFGIGTETSGSILSPAARCGLAGLRPTFGRISRYGVMALSWTQDRLGPICRYAEDCAIVMQAIAKPDGRDMSVSDMPFNWNAQLDIKKLKVGYIKESFDDLTNAVGEGQRGADARRRCESLGVTQFIPVTVPEFARERQRPRRRAHGVLRRARRAPAA